MTVVAAVVALSSNAAAQGHAHAMTSQRSTADSAVVHLVEQARAATEMYSDRRAAIAAGYRLVGRDLPSMGEHWINPALLIEGKFRVTRPQMLMYLDIAGHPVLTGIVYAIPLGQGETPPDAFGPTAMWHEHNGSVDDEALLAQHSSVPSAATGTRVAFLHVWTRIPASGGMFSAENWAIPFIRAGLPVPDKIPDGAARAISLVSGGIEFFSDMIGADAARKARPAFDALKRDVGQTVNTARREQRALSLEEIGILEKGWQRLVASVAMDSGSEAARKINGGL